MKQRSQFRRLVSSPILSASAVVHIGAAAAAVVQPSLWPWALGAVAANHGVLTAAGLWPRSRWLGPNWVTLPAASGARGEVAITIDDGPDPAVTPRVLAQLAQFDATATFFCVGERVQRYPELAREILRQGHVIENHSQRHRHDFSLLGPRRMHREIAEAQDSIAGVTGSVPTFFRAPAGLRNPFLQPLLDDLQLRLASWTRRGFDTVNGNPDVIYDRLTASLQGGDILLLHDANAARGPAELPVILDVLPRLLDTFRGRQLTPVTLRGALAGASA
jgi:peptidoglycan/xylan/chitin deacetylase (PgdA/CDA1 family)